MQNTTSKHNRGPADPTLVSDASQRTCICSAKAEQVALFRCQLPNNQIVKNQCLSTRGSLELPRVAVSENSRPVSQPPMDWELSRMISDPVPKDTAAGWPRQPSLRRKFKKISCGLLGPACLSRGGGVFADSALGRKDQKPLLQKLFDASFQRVVRLLHKPATLSLSRPDSHRQKRLEPGQSGGRRT